MTGMSSSSPSFPLARSAAWRLRLSCRASRPPRAPVNSSPSAGVFCRARRRSRPSRESGPTGGGTGAGPRWPERCSGGLRCSSLRRRSSVFLRCSASGFAPDLLARTTSAGSLISGFCGAGSAGVAECGRRFGRGGGQLCQADRRRGLGDWPRFQAVFSAARPAFRPWGLEHRRFTRDAGGRNVVFASVRASAERPQP